MSRDDAALLDMAKAARLIQSFTANMTKDEFLNDERTQSAVLYQLTILGEAVKRLSSEFRQTTWACQRKKRSRSNAVSIVNL
jgi:uncharacterized protein with HEPN domain